jgi:hypothetical protein
VPYVQHKFTTYLLDCENIPLRDYCLHIIFLNKLVFVPTETFALSFHYQVLGKSVLNQEKIFLFKKRAILFFVTGPCCIRPLCFSEASFLNASLRL